MVTEIDAMKFSPVTKVCGDSEQFTMDVVGDCGRNRACVNSVSRADAALRTAAISVTTTATLLRCTSADLANRRTILIQNLGTLPITIGNASVTVTTGIILRSNETIILDIAECVSIYALCASGVQDVRILEIA